VAFAFLMMVSMQRGLKVYVLRKYKDEFVVGLNAKRIESCLFPADLPLIRISLNAKRIESVVLCT
jgi:hypothetical protein